MKLSVKLFWEVPGEKEKFGKLIEGKETFEAINDVAKEFKLDFADARSAIEIYKTFIKK